jgi:Flp pilus assembly protein TadD
MHPTAPAPEPGERDSAYDLFRRGSHLLEQHHPGAAAVLLERASAMEPGKASILEALGRAYYNQGEHALAAERFRAVVDHHPLEHYCHFGLGLSLERLGDRAAARRHLWMAAFLKPEIDDYRRALDRLEAA